MLFRCICLSFWQLLALSACLIFTCGCLSLPKAATLGIGLILISAAIYFGDISVTSRVMAIIFFLFLTAPVAAHMIGRASYFIGTELWEKSVLMN
jgi:monovalent cation/proton antiporter MnhG/PhaG subunit